MIPQIFYSDAATQFSNCTNNAIRLIGGNGSNQGRLEVCVNSAWGSVCDSAGVFTSDEAKVVCRQLGILQVEGRKLFFTFILLKYFESSLYYYMHHFSVI